MSDTSVSRVKAGIYRAGGVHCAEHVYRTEFDAVTSEGGRKDNGRSPDWSDPG